MEHKLINTGYYLYIIDPEETSEVDKITFVKDGDTKPKVWYYNNNKILAHLPLNNSPILKGVDLLPPLEDDVEKLAKEYGELICNKDGTARFDFKRGYNKAKEKYKYTEEDLRKAYDEGYATRDSNGDVSYNMTSEQYIQSLQKPKMPIGFKCEMVKGLPIHNSNNVNVKAFIPTKQNTKINSEGLTQWIGEYIY